MRTRQLWVLCVAVGSLLAGCNQGNALASHHPVSYWKERITAADKGDKDAEKEVESKVNWCKDDVSRSKTNDDCQNLLAAGHEYNQEKSTAAWQKSQDESQKMIDRMRGIKH